MADDGGNDKLGDIKSRQVVSLFSIKAQLAEQDRHREHMIRQYPHVVEASFVNCSPERLRTKLGSFNAIRNASSYKAQFEFDDSAIRFFFEDKSDAVEMMRAIEYSK